MPALISAGQNPDESDKATLFGLAGIRNGSPRRLLLPRSSGADLREPSRIN
jgi:hypothetical protein